MSKLLTATSIPTKVVALLLLVGAVALGVAIVGSQSINRVDAEYSTLVQAKLPVTTKLARINRLATQMVYAGYRAMAYPGGSAEGRAAVEAERKAFDQAEELIAAIKKADPSAIELADEIQAELRAVHADAARAVKLGFVDQADAARAILMTLDQRIAALSSRIASRNDARIAEADTLSEALSNEAASTATMMYVIGIVGTLLGVGIAFVVARAGITTPLARLQETMGTLATGRTDVEVLGSDRGDEVGAMARAVLVFRDNARAQALAQQEKNRSEAEQKLVVEALERGLERLSDGDLTADIREEFSPAYATVKANFNGAVVSLRELVRSVATSATTIRTGSTEITQASENLARRTENNAASLEETTAAVNQMDGRLRATAEAAGRTVERADGAISTVSGGRAIADQAVEAMQRVASGAKGIDSVIEGLDKIAFQTRVLAMNAAVEAGRAGEAGRGFAVVADLVSALAMRSEEEASRARDQLTATQTDIVAAVEMVSKVDGALAEISESVGEVHTLLEQMATDNKAQSSAIAEISVAIGTMDQSTQQNAAMVEQTSAAARNLDGEVAALNERAAKFRTEASGPATPRRAPAKRDAVESVQPRTQLPPPQKPFERKIAPNGAGDWSSF